MGKIWEISNYADALSIIEFFPISIVKKYKTFLIFSSQKPSKVI